MDLRGRFRSDSLRADVTAGVVLGVQSVPDGLAGGLLAGVNPIYGLHAYLVGTVTGACFTSSSFMTVQATGAMALVVADVPALHHGDPTRALFTLSMLTGVVMLLAGAFRLGSLLRFVSNAVMVGFINAVGINIVLGQLDSLTGYRSDAGNRVLRALDTLVHFQRIDGPTLAIGIATIALILMLERTPIGSMALVVAVIVTSAAVVIIGWDGVARLRDLTDVPRSLPGPVLPQLGLVPVLLVPAFALAFVGLVQGAGISASFPNPDGNYPDASVDFMGQGAANVAVGIFQGMPVGGSLSATSLVREAGARSRVALLVAGAAMALVILAFGGVVGNIAMPALAGLLMVIGFRTVKPDQLSSVWRTGSVQKVVMATTFVLTMIVPLQYAVLTGVGLSLVLHVVRQSNQVTIRRRIFTADGHTIEGDPPSVLPPDEVVVIQPYGSLFFASAPGFEAALPAVAESSRGCVVIIRLRGRDDLGTTVMDVLVRYGGTLRGVGGRLILVSASERVQDQLRATGVAAAVGDDGIYPTDDRVGVALRQAHDDAEAWIESQRGRDATGDADT